MSETNNQSPALGASAHVTLSSNPAVASSPSAVPEASAFAALGLIEPLVRAVAESGYTTPTPIQVKAIPVVLAGRDVLAGAQTGTGKTAAFTLPLLQILSARGGKPQPKRPRTLILSPTRELSAQIEESVRVYGKYMRLTSTLVYGGVGMQPQVDALKRGVDILVATPGRLLDHAGEKTVDLSGVEILVLDEADRMLDMGFIRDIRKVLALLPKKRQNLLFSATFSDEIRGLASGLLHDPAEVEVARRNAETELVAQCCYLLPKDRKRDLLVHLVKGGDWRQVLVFTKTKHGANRLAEQLRKAGIEADAIHGNKSQGARTRALAGFKSGDVRVLVATDIAARGLDIEALPHVVNFDLPNVSEDYVHRIGRTGRAGMNGEAVSLVSPEDEPLLAAIERLMKKKVRREPLPAFAAAPQAAVDPREAEQARDEGGRGGQQPRRGEPRRDGARSGGGNASQRNRGERQPQANTQRAAGDGNGARHGGGGQRQQPTPARGSRTGGNGGRSGGGNDARRDAHRGDARRGDQRGSRPDANRRGPQPGAKSTQINATQMNAQQPAAQKRPEADEAGNQGQEKRRGTFASLLSAFLPGRS